MKVLCTADLHLGRSSSHLPAGVGSEEHSCAAAWGRVVRCAMSENVDLVTISGDLIDRQNRFFESFGPLERGLNKLQEAGIGVFAVTGNHDFDTLPEFARSTAFQNFRILGLGGRWEEALIYTKTGEPLRLLGWSFPAGEVSTDPIASFPVEESDVPTSLALLHCDPDQPGSRYAPVRSTDMKVRRMTAWLLGHVHRPVRHNLDSPLILNPGSPQAMDPGEAGGHAVWLMEIREGKVFDLRPVPLSTVQYDERDVDVTAVADSSQLRGLLVSSLSEYRDKLSENAELLVLVARLRLQGRTPLFSRIPTICRELEENSDLSSERLMVCLDRVENRTQPDFDLGALARIQDPPGVVARLLLALDSEQGGEEGARLLARASECMAGIGSSRPYEALDETPDAGLGAAREVVLRQGYLLLAHLLDQRGAQP
jgi:DNA repair protein SbcD/Mre11